MTMKILPISAASRPIQLRHFTTWNQEDSFNPSGAMWAGDDLGELAA
jgi:hypothetical protein